MKTAIDFGFLNPREPSRALRRSGFTLMELLVTVMVLTIGCLVALRMQTSSIKVATLADNITAATFMAESEMERLKTLSAAEISAEGEHGPVVEKGLDRLGAPCLPGEASCVDHIFTRTVTHHPGQPTKLSHQVEITVAWFDNSGPHSVVYSGVATNLSF